MSCFFLPQKPVFSFFGGGFPSQNKQNGLGWDLSLNCLGAYAGVILSQKQELQEFFWGWGYAILTSEMMKIRGEFMRWVGAGLGD